MEITLKKQLYLALAATTLLQPLAFADVTYRETAQITGGSMVGMLKMAAVFSAQARQATQPTTSTIMIHGSRMMRSNPHSTEIIDLDQQSITYVDTDKHTYSIVTFAQMQQAMAKAAAQQPPQPHRPNRSRSAISRVRTEPSPYPPHYRAR